MLSSKTRNTIMTLVASFSIVGVAASPAFAAGKGCTVEYLDANGKKSTITMEDGASITLGKTQLTCNNGDVAVKPASLMSPPETTTSGAPWVGLMGLVPLLDS